VTYSLLLGPEMFSDTISCDENDGLLNFNENVPDNVVELFVYCNEVGTATTLLSPTNDPLLYITRGSTNTVLVGADERVNLKIYEEDEPVYLDESE
jgi:hypothetical protein